MCTQVWENGYIKSFKLKVKQVKYIQQNSPENQSRWITSLLGRATLAGYYGMLYEVLYSNILYISGFGWKNLEEKREEGRWDGGRRRGKGTTLVSLIEPIILLLEIFGQRRRSTPSPHHLPSPLIPFSPLISNQTNCKWQFNRKCNSE